MADDFETIIKRIIDVTGIDRDELMARIRKKHEELRVVTLEGAAIMVGKELGVK